MVTWTKKDSWFEPFRAPQTGPGHELVAKVILQLENYERRQRARKARDKATFDETVTALVSDLCYHYCLDPEQKVSISRSKKVVGRKNRYATGATSAQRNTILDCMASPELALVVMVKGQFFEDRQTTIQAGPRLVTLILEHKVDERHFQKKGSTELIVLREKHEGWFKGKGKEVKYEDTPDTHRYREEMQRINDWLENADLAFDVTASITRRPVDIYNRKLRRIFTDSFTQLGRLSGGFWQDMPKQDRVGIRIDGQPTTCLDYSQSCPRILYSVADATPPSEDIYTVPLLREHRDGVKKLFLSLLCSGHELNKVPRGSRVLLPKKAKARDMFQWIGNEHPAIRPYFWTGIGLHLMFRESLILVDVLLALIDRGIVALPIHDAVVVREDAKELAKDIMQTVFKRHTGVDGMVKVE